ncbi:hypothetical protein M5F03_02485 [Acinetobacter sp. ANC 5579]|uniref:hypothetical protein n=1 Tax=Acinetobacter amyesii TaxID=2942470 RepID=UPI0020BF557B|nr:hypothetical protein [Acinetobacter amyesii]MCL6234045.1 hypothetical protein [Acinetobacter amyesii]
MNAAAKLEVMDWSKFTVDEWLKQYGAYISQCRMRGGDAPDRLEINQIHWLVRENDPHGRGSYGKFVYLQISEFEAVQIEKMLEDIRTSKRICNSGKVAVELYFQKMIRGLTLDQLDDEFTLSRSSINNMIFAGKYYAAGHDKRLRID